MVNRFLPSFRYLAYYCPHWKVISKAYKTHTPSNTACRSPGWYKGLLFLPFYLLIRFGAVDFCYGVNYGTRCQDCGKDSGGSSSDQFISEGADHAVWAAVALLQHFLALDSTDYVERLPNAKCSHSNVQQGR